MQKELSQYGYNHEAAADQVWASWGFLHVWSQDYKYKFFRLVQSEKFHIYLS